MDSELFKHDPGITKVGVERSRKIAVRLLEMYGEPCKIISSPFRRARETAMVMNMTLKIPLEEILIDNNISEYLGNHPESPLDVTKATQIHKPPHPETFDDMKKRVKRHIDKMRKKENASLKGVIWVITHGIIMKQVAAYAGIKNANNFPCLTCLSVLETQDMLKSEFLIFRGDLKHSKEIRSKKPANEKKPNIKEVEKQKLEKMPNNYKQILKQIKAL